ncbi:MAG TPA: MlaD family protein [Candidatus Saccharimonadales bacterium]|nr:MlaD family protein [Candidatus Saccharimonadales bacterium]
MEERFKFRHVNAITGTAVLLILAALIAAVIATGRTQRWFKSNVMLRIILPEAGAAGIRQGSEVYFLGTLVGSVSDVLVDATGHMQAETSIRRDFFRFVRADSSAVVKKRFGVAGDSFFELTRGNGTSLPEKNASIVCNEQFQSPLEVAIEELHHHAAAVLIKSALALETWTTIGSNLVTTRERVDQFMARADQIAAGLQQGKGTAGKLLTDSSAADDLKRTMSQASQSMEALQVTLQNLQKAGANVHLASTNFPAISDALGREARDLPGLVLQTQTSLREMERLFEAMQRHWLLRKYVNSSNPAPAHPLSAPLQPPRKPARVLRSPRDPAK